ncbi:MAG: hypothetical protein AAGG47_05400 [Pseudomonadota bacterium]
MTIARSTGACAFAVLVAAGPAQTRAQPVPEVEFARLLNIFIVQTGLGLLRSGIELTYDGVSSDPRSGELAVSGLRLRPKLPHDTGRDCEIGIARLTLADGGRFDRVDGLLSLGGVTVPAACLEPGPAAMASTFGYSVIEAENVAIEVAYDFASSALTLDIVASVARAADVTVAADFDYFWLQGVALDQEMSEDAVEDAEPVAILRGAEITLENRGLFEALEPLIGQQLGDPAAVPALVQAGLIQVLSGEGTRTPTAEELAFVEELSGEVGRFVADRDRLVVTLAPEAPVRLTEEMFEDPAAIVAALAPSAGSAPAARSAILDPALLSQLGEDADALDPATRLAVGRALVTGIGAPRALDAGIALLAPMAEAGDGAAALLVAEAAAAAGETEDAYRHALLALSAGKSEAVAIADSMEAGLDLDTILALQAAVTGTVAADGLLSAGDIGGMATLAERLATGHGGPRSYESALYWATLASAGGDRAAAALVRRLDNRFARRPEEAARWAEASRIASERALETWVAGGLAARVSVE